MVKLNEMMPDFVFNVVFHATPLLVFAVGLVGLVYYRYDMIRRFIALERMILAVNVFFVEVSFFYADVETTTSGSPDRFGCSSLRSCGWFGLTCCSVPC